APGEPARFPVLGLLGPLVFGVAVFAASGSRLSLALLGLSPFLALAAWADARLTARRKRRAADARFEAALAAARAELAELREREQRARHRGSPDPGRIADAITARNGLLWSRRRDAPDVLELRLGTGRARSRVRAELPAPNDAEPEHWRRLRAAARDAEELPGVPRTERLGACGALGVVGPAGERDGLARSLLLQLAALHAPTDLVIAAFAPEPKHRERAGWGWLGWLPHQGAASSPLRGPHLAGTPERAEALLAELEGIIRARSGESATAARPGPSRDDGPAIVVLIAAGAPGNRARLIGIAEAGAAVGVHALWLADRPERVPAACRSVVVVVPGPGTTAELIRTRAGRRVALDRVEHVAAAPAAQLARCLAPIVDDSERAPADHGLPRLAHLRELAARDLVGGAADILAAWAETDSLSGSWRPGTPRRVTGLAAIIGQDATGPLSVDLRAQGPHALIGGTTGSGKSEFLQSWIMSLAAQHSPERVTFLLVDYKGGNAFAECAQLPHTVGLVSDLTPELLRRALISLRAELAHREQRLNALGAKDLAELEARSEADAPPALLVVVDELAALTAAVPEFLDGLLDVAQRGRSLGVHLLLATQRPAGAVTANLRANLNLRIALRVADPEDSTDLLGVADAAGFDPGVPGRAALRVGSGPVRRFQSAYLGGRGGAAADTPGLADAGSAITAGAPGGVALSGLGFAEGVPLPGAQEHRRSAGAHHAPGTRGPRDIEALRDSIAAAVASAGLAPPRRPWLDPLPERLSLAELPGLASPGIALGLRDEPGQQRQRGYALDLARSGNAALIGASGSGKTSALVTLAVAANAAPSPSADSRGGGLHAHAPTHCYAIDAGGGLGALAALPTVGAVVPVEDAERIGRLLALFRDTITARVRATPPVSPAPRLLLLLDGFPAFRAVAEEHSPRAELLDQLGEILRTGRAVGVHAVLTADRPAAFGTEIAATLQEQLVLRLAAAEDAGALGVPAAVLADAPPGRAVLAGGTDPVQLALVATNASRDTGMPAPEPMAEIAAQLRARGVPPARPVPPLPERLRRAELPAPLIGAPPIFAVDTATLEPVGFPLGARCAVSGPAGSGLSTALRAMIEAFLGTARPGALRAPVAALRLSGPAGPDDHPEPAERFLAGVLASLESAEASERPDLIALELGPDDLGAEGEPLLSGVLAAAARVGSTVLLGAEQDALQASWPLLAELKRARWLLALRPHAEGGSPLVRVSL
ncbi:FtsK/SpoIIIE domain-containing protein, partial [Leucobacter sp. M11]|uniref:FtsK/SpoIIIE domain-containing protein n=1 Tax=Leucobacter sp. M11 TaxID=2993565 RepID=UPI002D7F742B